MGRSRLDAMVGRLDEEVATCQREFHTNPAIPCSRVVVSRDIEHVAGEYAATAVPPPGIAEEAAEQHGLRELDAAPIDADARGDIAAYAGLQREIEHAVQVETERAAFAIIDARARWRPDPG